MILILGMGKTGCATALFLQKKKIDFIIADSRPNPPYLEYIKPKLLNYTYIFRNF